MRIEVMGQNLFGRNETMRAEPTKRQARGYSAIRNPQSAFTLVELLVVITIIGILAALLLAAVQQARKAAARASITTEINQIDAALKDLKNSVGSFPPNAQTDGTGGPIVENTVLTDFKQFMMKAFPQHREPEALIKALVGLSLTSQETNIATNLCSGWADSVTILSTRLAAPAGRLT
jgi:prepilin-type N-terminal cleavage/methylation domain-containing protein